MRTPRQGSGESDRQAPAAKAMAGRRLVSAAGWRRRLLARELQRVRARCEEEHALRAGCMRIMCAIEDGFRVGADGAISLAADRGDVDELLAAMYVADGAIQRARAAGVEDGTIERITQLAWPLACALFETIGWDEAFRARADPDSHAPSRAPGSALAHPQHPVRNVIELHASIGRSRAR